MVRLIGRGWRALYEFVKKAYPKCVVEHQKPFLIMTVYGNEPVLDPENPAYYAVAIRCGWRETIPELGGMIGGLTYEQWYYIHTSSPKPDAILAVGPEWISLEDAHKKFEEYKLRYYY